MVKWKEVTWYSKLAAIIFFIGVLPSLTFYIGTKYEDVKNLNQNSGAYFYLNHSKPTSNIPSISLVETDKFCEYMSSSTSTPIPPSGIDDNSEFFKSFPLTCTFYIKNNLPIKVTFENKTGYQNFDSARYTVVVRDSQGKELIQFYDSNNKQPNDIAVPCYTTCTNPTLGSFLINHDYNHDGYEDIRVITYYGMHEPSFKTYLYNSTKNIYEMVGTTE